MYLTYTNADKVEQGMVEAFSLDLAFGSDENDFELTMPMDFQLDYGSLVYVDGTEWGGIIDRKKPDTTGDVPVVIYSGRTWHGIMANSIICPPDGESHYEYSGEANAVLRGLVSYMGLSDVFSVSSADSGIEVSGQFDRFTDMYSGVRKALSDSGAKLRVEKPAGRKPILSAAPIGDYIDGVDSDRYAFRFEHAHRKVNHLVCTGIDEMEDRVVIHLYADEDGNVSQTQTLFGLDEITEHYDYSNADYDTLLEKGTERLEGYQDSDTCDLVLPESAGFEIGDVVGVLSAETGIRISSVISKVIVKVGAGAEPSISYDIGTVQTSRPGSSSGGSSSGGIAYVAGEGITITGGTISADVTEEELAAVAAEAIPTSWIEAL